MPAAPVRKVPYKDFLQPVLQRRFTSTAGILLAVSYLEAVFFASWNSYFWSWFPLGPATFRTAHIFACGLPILILRIAQYHVGLRTTGSGWQTITVLLTKFATYETAFWYGLSSALFCPVFLWSVPESSNLDWVTYFSGDRARLNERPLFLATYLGVCALCQTIVHYAYDVDRLVIGTCAKSNEEQQQQNSHPKATLKGSVQNVLVLLPAVFARCVKQALATLGMTFVIYYALLRPLIWGWALSFWRIFYNLPKTNILPRSWPIDIYLLSRCIYAGTFLSFVWAAGNTAFSAFMVKAPLKNGKPLTSESKDPNGSLLNGLKSKKQPAKDFALWELALVATEFDIRRQAIFQDIDRKDGPMWSQVYATCMDLIKSVETRIDGYGKPPVAPPPPETTDSQPKQRVAAPLREDPIYRNKTKFRDGAGKAAGQITRSSGSSPVSKLSPLAKKTWNDAKGRLLSYEQQKSVSPDQLRSQFEQQVTTLMSVDVIRKLFLKDFRTEFAAATLGTPHAEPASYVNAIVALTQLAVRSLKEDQFGNVYRDVPSIIRSLTALIKKLEAFRLRFPVHWTDAGATRESSETKMIVDAARAGLTEVVECFEPYMNDLRLTLTDLRLAKEAAAEPVRKDLAPEMKEAKAKHRSR